LDSRPIYCKHAIKKLTIQWGFVSPDLYCVGWGVKFYSLTHSSPILPLGTPVVAIAIL